MKDKIYYYDHTGALKLTLNEWPYYSEPSDLKDWSWGYNEQFGRFNTFRRNKGTYTLVIGIAGGGPQAHDALCDIFTADIMAGAPGRLVLRGWSLACYITEAVYAYGRRMDRKAEFNVLAIDSVWTRTTTRMLTGEDSTEIPEGDGRWRDYMTNRGYKPSGAYGYNVAGDGIAYFDLVGTTGNGYEAKIYGPVENPSFYVNKNRVEVDVEVPPGSYLEIISNGGTRTITLVSSTGVRENVFNLRDKEASPFVDIGSYLALGYGSLKMEFSTIERRSEPTWN